MFDFAVYRVIYCSKDQEIIDTILAHIRYKHRPCSEKKGSMKIGVRPRGLTPIFPSDPCLQIRRRQEYSPIQQLSLNTSNQPLNEWI